MKRIFLAFFCLSLIFGMSNLQAQSKSGGGQNKSTSSKSTSKLSNSKKSKKKKKTNERPKPVEVALTYNSNDCLYAMPLSADVAFGPTQAPQGAGRVMEIKADKKHPNLFEYEHNTVWYKFTVPYNGNLEFTITPTNAKDDYDFLLYRYTDAYFSNNIIQNKVLPIAGHLGMVDSTSKDGSFGMRHNAKGKAFVKAGEYGSFIPSIPVYKGEVFYLVLDNKTVKGAGHTVKVSIQVDAVEPEVRFYDSKTKKAIPVDLTISEKETGERIIVSNNNFRSARVKFVPNYTYTIRANKPGYFSIYKENVTRELFMADTVLRFEMNRTEKGTRFPISDISFEDGESNLMPSSDTVLMEYAGLFLNHPNVTFLIKGYVNTYGVNPPEDQRISLERAESVKQFMIKHGIAEERMRVAGMSTSEIKKVASSVIDRKQAFSPVKVELIITSMGEVNYK